MTNEELCRLAQEGDQQAAEQLIVQNEAAIRGFAWRYMAINEEDYAALLILQDDLEQEGRLAIRKAIRNYDAGRGAKFLTYAARIMKNRIIDLYEKQKQARQPPEGLLHLSLDEMTDKEQYVQHNCRTAPDEDLSFSIDEMELHELSVNYYRPPDTVYIWMETIWELYRAMSQLTDRQLMVIRYRYGFHDGEYHTREATGEHFGTDVKTIRSTETKALNSMRKEMTGGKKRKTRKKKNEKKKSDQ